MFIRIKNRVNNGKSIDYAYLVENKYRKEGVKQKVKGYLGRIYRFDIVKGDLFKIEGESYGMMLKSLYGYELERHGFKLVGGVFVNGRCYVDLENLEVYNKNGRKIVLQINAGFVCEHSLKELFNLKFEDSEDFKKEFAKKLVLSGLDIKPDVFVGLYGRLVI